MVEESFKMNIIIITELFWGMEENLEQELGIGTSAIYDLVKHWSEENNVICIREIPMGWKRWLKNEIGLLFGRDNVYNKVPAYYEVEGIKVYTVKYLSFPHNKIIGCFFYRRIAKKINNSLKKISSQPDIIISHMPTFNVMYYIGLMFKNTLKLAVLHRSDLDRLFKGQKVVKDRVDLLKNNFDKIFSRSQAIYNRAKETGLPNLTSNIILSSVPMNESENRDWLNLHRRQVNILYAGSLIAQKGVQQILYSMKKLIDENMLRLTIVGTGNYEKNLRKITKDLEIEEYVDFVGRKHRDEVYAYMREADLFIMPSYHETFGLVYLEAMSSGCITIGSRGEGIDGVIVDRENGFLVNPYDVDEIAGCLETIISLPEMELKQISDKAVETAHMYSEENVSKQYLKLIEEIVEE